MRGISETVSDVLETWEGRSKCLLSQMTKKKKKKKKKKTTTDPHRESRAKKEEKGKDNGNLQDMCKNHRACNRKRGNLQNIICGLQ